MAEKSCIAPKRATNLGLRAFLSEQGGSPNNGQERWAKVEHGWIRGPCGQRDSLSLPDNICSPCLAPGPQSSARVPDDHFYSRPIITATRWNQIRTEGRNRAASCTWLVMAFFSAYRLGDCESGLLEALDGIPSLTASFVASSSFWYPAYQHPLYLSDTISSARLQMKRLHQYITTCYQDPAGGVTKVPAAVSSFPPVPPLSPGGACTASEKEVIVPNIHEGKTAVQRRCDSPGRHRRTPASRLLGFC